MKIENLNQWLSLGGNIAVVLGILFLAYEINQNTKTTQLAAQQSLVQNAIDFNSLLVSDPEIARIRSAGRNQASSLSDNDRLRYQAFVRILIQQAQLAFAQHEMGFLDDVGFEGSLVPIVEHIRRSPVARAQWEGLSFLPVGFVTAINTRVQTLGYIEN